jgi:GT2 family glycosyltransferase
MRGLADLFATRPIGELLQKAVRLWRREGLRGIRRVFFTIGRFQLSYSRWVAAHDTLIDSDRNAIRDSLKTFGKIPVISILLTISDPAEHRLRPVIQSIRRQLYPHWELFIVPAESMPVPAEDILREWQQSDQRIRTTSLPGTDVPVPLALNAALAEATGEYLALLDGENELSEHALYLVARTANDREAVLLYGDEDSIDERRKPSSPYFKPDWNPDLFFAQNYLENFAVFRTEAVRSIGGFSKTAGEACKWDLALKMIDRLDPAQIHHIPHVLCHKYSFSEPTGVSAGLVVVGQRRAAIRVLENYWLRHGLAVRVEALDCGHFRTFFPLPDPPPLVSIIIPTRNGLALLQRCLDGLFDHTDYPNKEIIVVDNGSDDPATLDFLAELAGMGQIRLLKYGAPFNFSAINNMAVSHAAGSLICLLNNDVEPIRPDWLREMASHAVRREIGAVGAMLYYPDDTIQHAGVVLNGVVAGHLYAGFPRGYAGEACRAKLVQNLSAVTAACLLVRREVWDEAGGMDEANLAVAFNDVDFCLKVRQCGYRNLWTPFAELYHHESASRGREDTPEKMARVKGEIACMQQRWGGVLSSDPAWNPNLELDGSWPRPAHPPRAEKPWKRSDSPSP